jgi:hypothetical protein
VVDTQLYKNIFLILYIYIYIFLSFKINVKLKIIIIFIIDYNYIVYNILLNFNLIIILKIISILRRKKKHKNVMVRGGPDAVRFLVLFDGQGGSSDCRLAICFCLCIFLFPLTADLCNGLNLHGHFGGFF